MDFLCGRRVRTNEFGISQYRVETLFRYYGIPAQTGDVNMVGVKLALNPGYKEHKV